MPLFVMLPRKTMPDKKYILNLNYYRNWHPMINNNVKKKYKEVAAEFISELRFDKKVELKFVLWKATKRKTDRANPLCVHEKFFCDALTELGCIPDDNDDHVIRTIYETGGIDRKNPRVDIHIREA